MRIVPNACTVATTSTTRTTDTAAEDDFEPAAAFDFAAGAAPEPAARRASLAACKGIANRINMFEVISKKTGKNKSANDDDSELIAAVPAGATTPGGSEDVTTNKVARGTASAGIILDEADADAAIDDASTEADEDEQLLQDNQSGMGTQLEAPHAEGMQAPVAEVMEAVVAAALEAPVANNAADASAEAVAVAEPEPAVKEAVAVAEPEPAVQEDAAEPQPAMQQAVAVAEPEPAVQEDVAEPEPAVQEDVAEHEPAVQEDVAEHEPAVQEDVAEHEPAVQEDVAEPEPAVQEDVAEHEPAVQEDVAEPEPAVQEMAAAFSKVPVLTVALPSFSDDPPALPDDPPADALSRHSSLGLVQLGSPVPPTPLALPDTLPEGALQGPTPCDSPAKTPAVGPLAAPHEGPPRVTPPRAPLGEADPDLGSLVADVTTSFNLLRTPAAGEPASPGGETPASVWDALLKRNSSPVVGRATALLHVCLPGTTASPCDVSSCMQSVVVLPRLMNHTISASVLCAPPRPTEHRSRKEQLQEQRSQARGCCTVCQPPGSPRQRQGKQCWSHPSHSSAHPACVGHTQDRTPPQANRRPHNRQATGHWRYVEMFLCTGQPHLSP